MSHRSTQQRKTQPAEKKEAGQRHKADAQPVSPKMLQRAILQPGQARPQDILKLQQSYGSQAVSRLLAAKLAGHPAGQPIQKTEQDGKPDPVEEILKPAVFKSLTSKATWIRDDYTKTIDVWLQTAANAQTWDEQQHALQQVVDACDAWLDKHGAEKQKKEASSVSGRRPLIRQVRKEAAGGAAPSAGKSQQSAAKQSVKKEGKKALEGGISAITDGAGITGSLNDVNVNTDTKDGTWGKEGSKNLNRAEFDMLEGANMLGGWVKIFGAKKAHEKGENLDAAKQGMEGVGQAAHGVTKFSKGVGLKNLGPIGEEDKAKQAVSAKWGQAGDSGAACADGLAFISGLISFGQSLSTSAVTSKEKVDKGLDVAANATNATRSGVSTAMDIVKAATQGGPKDAIAGLATTAGALGIVAGAIEIAQGGLQYFRASAAEKELQQAEAKAAEIIGPVFEKLQKLTDQLKGLTTEELVAIFKVKALLIELEKLKKIFAEMQQLSQAMQAMRKIQSRRMEEGKFKAAKGLTAVVSGGLLVSGFGAPIAVGIAALGGIMALGSAGVQWRRNAAASRLNTVALRLTDDGQPKGKADPTAPDYRTMEKRIYKCYYTHLPEVISEKTPPGMTSDQFLDVKRFTWSDKKGRVSYKQTIPYKKVDDIPRRDSEEVKNNWLVISDEKNKAIKKEAPTGSSWAKLKLTASAHKSKQSMKASKTEVVDALYQLGSQSWNEEKQSFVEAPIVPQGEADPDTMKQMKSITLNALLKAADINAARWKKWLTESQGDEKKMKELISKKMG